ncbi:DNA replication regulator sld2 [Nannizzia gypsea CBS 118893]|uniref:DNA replication regulator SLD2 n=1 Tax=Arthroderma gypseum (strain ATCC MYA-4604 / CBS 118893) TaxID=535722 RepID=E4UXT1_ARTGP|nr:DNA replication regulator sld2 [Nannizzia gypsea CBS 118893]EFR02763.1 DNA replication regulator sld2 [Nannizzia gypsea CBS 118893]
MDADADAKATSLRAELKQWEKTFTLQTSRKPGRDDIKNNPAIAEKYKEYSRLRSESSQNAGKEKEREKVKPAAEQQTPKRTKRHCPFEDDSPAAKPKICTPSRTATTGGAHPSRIDPYDSPSNVRRLNGAREQLPLYEAIGPTPQRDGKALGLFDLLGSPGQKTPRASRRSAVNVDDTRGNGDGVAQTPSRKVPGTPSSRGTPATARRLRYASTPLSSARKFYLASFFATPTANRCTTIPEEEDEDNAARGGGALESDTPSFLRRKNIFSPAKANAGVLNLRSPGPVAVRMPQKLFGKGISSFAKRLQEERDAETKEAGDEQSEDRVEETQIFSDHALDNDDNGDGNVHRSPSKAEKTYKKKGQKRTTKLSRLRPSRAKPAVQPSWESLVEDSDDELATTETAAAPAEDDGSSDGPDADGACIPKSRDKHPKKPVKPSSNTAVGKKPRKIKAEAHANYRSLKIRSRGGQKGGGRFGRR